MGASAARDRLNQNYRELHNRERVKIVRYVTGSFFHTAIAVCLCLLVTTMTAGPAHAQTYTKLQVLLPGEVEAPGTPDGKAGSPAAQAAGVPFNIRIRACDNSWNTVISITHSISLSCSDETAALSGQVTLASGEATLAVTFNAGGSFTIAASDLTDPTVPEAVSDAVLSMVLQGFLFNNISQKHCYAGTPENYTLTAVDAGGSTVTGYTGTVRLRQITSYGEGRITPDEVTLTNGVWSGQLSMYRADESSINRGNVNIYAYLESAPSKNGTSDPFIVHPGSFSRLQIVVPGQDPLPGSLTGFTGSPASQAAGTGFYVDVFATDQYWNPVSSFDVAMISSSDPAASTPVSGAMTDGHGQYTVSLGTVGAQTLTVTNQSNGSITGMTSDPVSVIPSAPDHFEISTISSPLTAGVPVSITIRAADVGGNTIPEYQGDAILAANTGPGSITPEAIIFSGGEWTGEMTFRGAGAAVSFTCSDFSAPPHTGTSMNFQVLPGALVGLQVLLPGQTARGGTASGYSGEPSAQNAGSQFTARIRAVDSYWNLVPDVNDRISLESTDLFAGMPAETTLASGEISVPVTLYYCGMQAITASDIDDTGVSSHTSRPVEIVPGAYAKILLLAPGEESAPGTETGRTGTATDQSISYSFTVTVYATDQWFNPVTGVGDMVRLTSNDPLAELPADTPLSNGRADFTIRLSTGGFQQLTATNVTQPSMPVSTTQVRAISSGFHLEAEIFPPAVQAGEEFELTVKVTNDAGSVIQEINTFVNLTVMNASTQDPGKGDLLVTSFQLLQGQRTVTETYSFAEPIIIVATDDMNNDPAATGVLVVSPGDPDAVELSCSPSWVGGNKHATVNAAVVDAFGNGIPGREVLFELTAGEGSLTPVDTLTGEDGIAEADFYSPREPGVSRVRAEYGPLAAELDIETALVDPSLPGGTITNYPNPFHPGEGSTTIAYKLSDNADVTLRIFTLTGNLVLREDFPNGSPGGASGLNEFEWDGRNGNGGYVSSGGYIVYVEAEGNGETLHVMRRRLGVVR
jgi:hypothetical protein